MSRSESRLDADSPVGAMAREAAGAIGQAIVRNPLAVGGATAFIVAMSYICGNALWNQAQPHNSASAASFPRVMGRPCGSVVAG